MRGKRAKQYRKLMHQYQHTFNFREPYQVLVDAEIIQDAAQFTMDLVAGLKRTLQGEIKPMITQCSMRHLYNARPKNEELIRQAKTFERRRCNHHELEEPMSTLECFSEVVDPKGSGTNKNRYVVASQDQEVRMQMRRKLGVPLIYIKKSVMILEPMAAESEEVREKEERNKFRTGLIARPTKSSGVKRKREDQNTENGAEEVGQGNSSAVTPTKKKARGERGPNPLSVKKSKKKAPISTKPMREKANATEVEATADGTDQVASKRKRKRKQKTGEKSEQDEDADTESVT